MQAAYVDILFHIKLCTNFYSVCLQYIMGVVSLATMVAFAALFAEFGVKLRWVSKSSPNLHSPQTVVAHHVCLVPLLVDVPM